MPRRLLSGTGSLTLFALLFAACGARTELLTPDPCATEGMTRSCQDGCGEGNQTCQAGLWSKCQVPIAVRACSDLCGAGQETCVDGAWQACLVPEIQRPCSSVCGAGNETCRNGAWGKCDAPLPKPPQLLAQVRDFSPTTHPDFEAAYQAGLDKGIVQPTLAADGTPSYAGRPTTKSTSGVANFDKWFHDDPVNVAAPLELQLKPSKDDPGLFEYDNHAFFPIDGMLLGNEGRSHNFHFTLQASTSFEYRGGEVFSFAGDDDMWVFINRQLAIDLGGLHQSLSAKVALDDIATSFGLVRGQIYSLSFFFAERHTTQSNFTLRTSISDPGSCE